MIPQIYAPVPNVPPFVAHRIRMERLREPFHITVRFSDMTERLNDLHRCKIDRPDECVEPFCIAREPEPEPIRRTVADEGEYKGKWVFENGPWAVALLYENVSLLYRRSELSAARLEKLHRHTQRRR